MKKTTLFIFILTICTWANAQFSYLKDVELETKEDFEEYSEAVIDCCDYLLLTPYDKKDNERHLASDFISRWLTKHPSYTFEVNESINTLLDEDKELLGLYTTCCAQMLLESEEELTYQSIELLAIKPLLEYCAKPMNKVKLTKELKKMIELNNKGELASIEEYYDNKDASN